MESLQPVLPAALVAPTKLIWKMIYIARSLGWYALLPMLILSFVAAAGEESEKDAKSDDVVVASRVDLDPAFRVTRWRRPVG